MPKDWTDDEIKAAIKEAVDIVHEDRERAQYATLHERFGEKPPEGDGKNPPPPKKEEEPPPDPPATRSIWWPKGSLDS